MHRRFPPLPHSSSSLSVSLPLFFHALLSIQLLKTRHMPWVQTSKVTTIHSLFPVSVSPHAGRAGRDNAKRQSGWQIDREAHSVSQTNKMLGKYNGVIKLIRKKEGRASGGWMRLRQKHKQRDKNRGEETDIKTDKRAQSSRRGSR